MVAGVWVNSYDTTVHPLSMTGVLSLCVAVKRGAETALQKAGKDIHDRRRMR